jgi:hypothetical protein
VGQRQPVGYKDLATPVAPSRQSAYDGSRLTHPCTPRSSRRFLREHAGYGRTGNTGCEREEKDGDCMQSAGPPAPPAFALPLHIGLLGNPCAPLCLLMPPARYHEHPTLDAIHETMPRLHRRGNNNRHMRIMARPKRERRRLTRYGRVRDAGPRAPRVLGIPPHIGPSSRGRMSVSFCVLLLRRKRAVP